MDDSAKLAFLCNISGVLVWLILSFTSGGLATWEVVLCVHFSAA